MISFDAAHRSVHYPPDRRFRIWIRHSILIGTGVAIVSVIAAAWIEVAVAGLPRIPPVPQIYPNNFTGPHGFPLWVRYCHFFNFFFVMFLIRSGLSILVDHPRLYFNEDCTPGSEWIRFTPLKVPRDRIWTAKDDARYISPLVGTPGYRHTIGVARIWHFINVHGFIITGVVFVAMLFGTEQWRRIVPTSHLVLLQAWNTWVHYATFHLPVEPNGFYGYNALQQIAYFVVVFVFGVTAILTGIGMSPAVVNRFPWYPKLFGGAAGGAVDSFPYHAQLPRIPRSARDSDRDDRLRAKHEPHRHGHRRSNSYGHSAGICRHWRGSCFLGCCALSFLASCARIAACAQGRDLSDATAYVKSVNAAAKVQRGRNLTLLLAKRENADPGRLETSRGRRFRRLPA